MAKTFQAQLLTPEGALFDGKVVSVSVPGSSGNFQVLSDHAPIVSSLGVGKITIDPENESELLYAVSGGFVEMSENQLTVLAENAIRSDQIDVEEAKRRRNEAREKLEGFSGDRKVLEYDLTVAENQLNVARS